MLNAANTSCACMNSSRSRSPVAHDEVRPFAGERCGDSLRRRGGGDVPRIWTTPGIGAIGYRSTATIRAPGTA